MEFLSSSVSLVEQELYDSGHVVVISQPPLFVATFILTFIAICGNVVRCTKVACSFMERSCFTYDAAPASFIFHGGCFLRSDFPVLILNGCFLMSFRGFEASEMILHDERIRMKCRAWNLHSEEAFSAHLGH